MPAINSRCRQWHKPSFLLLDSFRPVFRQVLKSCTFLFFMLSGLLKPHNHPSLIPLISENQPFPAYSLLSFRECSFSAIIRTMQNPLSCPYQKKVTIFLLCQAVMGLVCFPVYPAVMYRRVSFLFPCRHPRFHTGNMHILQYLQLFLQSFHSSPTLLRCKKKQMRQQSDLIR